MIGIEEVKSLNSPYEFKNSMIPNGFLWSETPTIETNTAYYDESGKYVVVNSMDGKSAFFYLIFDNISLGDKIEIEMLVKGLNVGEGIQRTPSVGVHHVSDTSPVTGVTFLQQKFPQTSEWETVRFTHYAIDSRRLRIDFGMYSAETGIFYIKSARAKATKKNADNGLRKMIIRQNLSVSPLNWEVVNGDGCSFTIDSVNKTLKVIYDRPFKTHLNPIPIAQSEFVNDSDLITFSTSDSLKESCLLKFRDSSGSVLDPNVPVLSSNKNFYMKLLSFGDIV